MISYLNPASDNFILKKIINFFKTLLEYLDPSSDNDKFILKGVINFFKDFFDNLLHIFVPTKSQWQEIQENYRDLGTILQEHIPFVSFIKSTFTDIEKTTVIPKDILIVEIPSFQYFGGETGESKHIEVLQAYEPFRLEIRSLLTMIVYGCGFVYIVKKVLNYGSISDGMSESSNIKENKK